MRSVLPLRSSGYLQPARLVAALLVMAACASHDTTTPASGAVATISLSISAVTLAPQQTATVTATPRDAAGDTLTGRSVGWASSAPAIATIDSHGVVTAVAGGMATLTATIEGKSAAVTISVSFPAAVPDTGCGGRNLASASELVGCIRQDELWTHMTAFQQIATANPGTDGHPSRNSGEPGYLASVNYVADLLRRAGYTVTIQPYNFTYTGVASVPLVSELSPVPHDYSAGPDYQYSNHSGSGDVTAQLQSVAGIVIPAPTTPNSTSSGCTATAFAGFVPGRVALIQRGNCSFNQQLSLAVAAGAAAVIIFNEGSTGESAAGNCAISIQTIPVVCLASYAVGQALYNQTQQAATTVHIRIQPISEVRPDYNLIADSPFGDPSKVVVVDAHLDAIHGAGMLDNASGSATILEIALKMARTHTRNQLRYIWFGGEELGLLGSAHYTSTLAAPDRANIVFDIDADVTATPNYFYAIADPGGFGGTSFFPANVVPASQVGNNYFSSYFAAAGLPVKSLSSLGTDSFEFGLIGIPNSGILTGQDCCKSGADVTTFGGFTGNYEGTVPGTDGGCVDRSFLWCDNLSNNDPVILTIVTKAFASVTFSLANDATLGAPVPPPPTSLRAQGRGVSH